MDVNPRSTLTSVNKASPDLGVEDLVVLDDMLAVSYVIIVDKVGIEPDNAESWRWRGAVSAWQNTIRASVWGL